MVCLWMSGEKWMHTIHKRFLSFCTKNQSPRLPVTETLLCHYVASLADQKLKYQTIKCYSSAVWFLQIMSGFGDPNMSSMPFLEYLLHGIKLEKAKQRPDATHTHLPVTPTILHRLRQSLITSLRNGKTSYSRLPVIPVSLDSSGQAK